MSARGRVRRLRESGRQELQRPRVRGAERGRQTAGGDPCEPVFAGGTDHQAADRAAVAAAGRGGGRHRRRGERCPGAQGGRYRHRHGQRHRGGQGRRRNPLHLRQHAPVYPLPHLVEHRRSVVHIPDGAVAYARGTGAGAAAVGEFGHGRAAGHGAVVQSTGEEYHAAAATLQPRAPGERVALLPLSGHRHVRGRRDGGRLSVVVSVLQRRSASELGAAVRPRTLFRRAARRCASRLGLQCVQAQRGQHNGAVGAGHYRDAERAQLALREREHHRHRTVDQPGAVGGHRAELCAARHDPVRPVLQPRVLHRAAQL
eukprot:ctg_510.g315